VSEPAVHAPDPPQTSLARTILRDGAIYAVAGVLSQGIAFLLFPFFAHVFEPRDYGIIDLLGVMTTLVNLTVALEISQGLGRHFAEATDADERRSLASTAFLFAFACYSVFVALALAFAGPVTEVLLGSDVDPTILRIAVCVMWANGIGYLSLELLRWQLRPWAFAVSSITITATVTASSAVLVLVFDLGVEGAVIGQLIGFAAGGLVAFTLTRHLYRLRFDRARLRQMLSYSLPLVPASTGVFLNGYADRLAIQSRLDLDAVGVYGVSYRLSLVVGLTLIGFQGALLPQVLRNHEKADTPLQLVRVFRLFTALALTVLLVVSTWADELVRVLTQPAYYEAADIVPLVLAAAFCAGMYIFAPGPNIAKRTKIFAAITLGCGILNFGVAMVIVKPLGIAGAALSFLASQALAFGVLMALSQRLYPAPHQWRRLASGVAVGAGLTALGWALPAAGDVPWIAAAKAVLCAVGILALARLLMDPDERQMGLRFIRAWRVALSQRGRARLGGSTPDTGAWPRRPPGP
jgi:O-antigen/teichoic acid export membrane protein